MADNKTNGTSRLDRTTVKNGEDATADVVSLAEEAEAEAAEAEALAAAARARARAIRLRRQAAEADGGGGYAVATNQVESFEAESGEAAEAEAAEVERAEGESGKAIAEPAKAEPAEGEAAEAVAEPAEAAEAAEVESAGRRSRMWGWIALGFTCLLICAVLVATGLMVWRHHTAAVQNHRRAEYAAAARQGVVSLMTLDFHHAKDDVQRVIDNSTGEFRDDFQNRADDFTKVVQDSKVVTKGTVNATAVESMTDNSAVVLVAASSQVTNATGAQNEPRAWRLSVSVQKDGGQIKMSKVEFVP